ncbi:hypothetical protein [Flavobacterium sp. A45]|nr:hypothetical protein [Flavobacterium sp. A45]
MLVEEVKQSDVALNSSLLQSELPFSKLAGKRVSTLISNGGECQ